MNKFISAFVVIAGLFAHVECYLDSNGQCTRHEMTCSQECTAVAYCSGNGVMPVLFGCYGDSPYCNQGRCSNSYNPNCNQPYKPLFYCPQEDGTYPDPLDCSRFHICLNGTAYTSYCNYPGLVFSTETLSCVWGSNKHQCGKVRCNGNGTWATYSTDQAYAFYCRNDRPTLVKRCTKSHVFNVNTEKCEFKCFKEGLFQDENNKDPASYIECSLLYGRDFMQTRRNCPNNAYVESVFDPKTSQCVSALEQFPTNLSSESYLPEHYYSPENYSPGYYSNYSK